MHFSSLSRYSEAEQFADWGDGHTLHTLSYSPVASNASSFLDGGLVEETSRLSLMPAMSHREAMETSAFTGEMLEASDEERKIRDILIEKMEQHATRMQELRGTKKQTTSMPEGVEKPLLYQAENDDMIMLDDAEHDFSLDDNIPGYQEVDTLSDDNLEVTGTGSELAAENYQQLMPKSAGTGDKSEGYRFSRLIAERHFASPVGRTVEDQYPISCRNIFLGDPECHNDRQETDEAVTAWESETSKVCTTHSHDMNDTSYAAPARPPSPEFDIEMPEHKASLPNSILCDDIMTEYSLISEADGCQDRSLGDKGEMEACGRKFAAIESAEVSADEDGGFLSVLSEAAVYHASLKHMPVEPVDSGGSVQPTEDSSVCSGCSQDVSHCACVSAAPLSACDERGGTETRSEPLPFCETFSECREERQGEGFPGRDFGKTGTDDGSQECPGRDLGKTGADDGSDSSVYVIQEGSMLENSLGSHMGSLGQEMDASGDLNDSDRRKIADMKKMESRSDEEGFDDTVEEMELVLKFGLDYVMGTDDKVCHGTKGEKQSLSHSMSTPMKPVGEMSEFEDFGDAIDQVETPHHPADGAETSCQGHSPAVAAEACVSSASDQNSVPSSHYVKTLSASEEGENLFVKPQTTSVRKPHIKLQAPVSPTLKNNKPGPFKIPGKPMLLDTPVPKLLAPRSAKKSPLKATVTASPCRRPFNYSKIVSPVGAYIHNTPSPSLVTIVKPKLLRAVTTKGTLIGRAATATEMHDSLSAVEKTCLEVGSTCIQLTFKSSCSLTTSWQFH
jgi:hypothetical protein